LMNGTVDTEPLGDGRTRLHARLPLVPSFASTCERWD
jgi:hypothetical protein